MSNRGGGPSGATGIRGARTDRPLRSAARVPMRTRRTNDGTEASTT